MCPILTIREGCCARAAIGQEIDAAVLPRSVMKSRRFMCLS